MTSMCPTVLDPASGGRMMYFDKHDPRVLFGDIRDESWELCDGRRFDVHPDQLMDYRKLPFKDNSYRLVVFDPPHLEHAGSNSYMVKKYGKLPADWKQNLTDGFTECFRVLAGGGYSFLSGMRLRLLYVKCLLARRSGHFSGIASPSRQARIGLYGSRRRTLEIMA
ncbi:hypothetical protein [Bombiscardovia coagulans]|uniref:Methyltransferase n=1 Tax=Bombiscardovia coagulans TaxID=686666 RepID=A0A261EST2_9BIFI|nr:hypothetical protein [Bombiscardovia coagulans]OZG49885.1 methyltransferase [Bombiscardovia coagulans]